MNFKTLADKCEYYRSLTDYRLMPGAYTLIMLDGRSFSKMIKKKFKLPFDDKFINMMNETAMYVCSQVEGAKIAYVQSDEMSILITDFDRPETCSFFGYRLCKMLSIIASLATAKFNQLAAFNLFEDRMLSSDVRDELEKMPLIQFDCKAWQVPNQNDAFAWFLYRQNDCIRNSKQQTAQTWLPHKALLGLDTDKQIDLLKEQKGIDWNDFPNNQKYGRFIYKVEDTFYVKNTDDIYTRNVWKAHDAFLLKDEEGHAKFIELLNSMLQK